LDFSPVQEREVGEAAAFLGRGLTSRPRIGVVLGSGLGPVRAAFRIRRRYDYGGIPNFPVSTVAGHRGELLLGERGRHRVWIMDGRVHRYEGHSFTRVTLPVRVLAGLGVRTMIITNSAGGVGPGIEPGDLMLIEDHIDLLWGNLRDLSHSPATVHKPYYSPGLMELASRIALREGVRIKKGVLLATTGPSYETRAEVEFVRSSGADAVSMSTVPEVTVCHQLGISVLGISLITNLAASHGGGHQKVIDFAAGASENLGRVISGVIDALQEGE
jgi:purine-nucleoside phosphorylase